MTVGRCQQDSADEDDWLCSSINTVISPDSFCPLPAEDIMQVSAAVTLQVCSEILTWVPLQGCWNISNQKCRPGFHRWCLRRLSTAIQRLRRWIFPTRRHQILQATTSRWDTNKYFQVVAHVKEEEERERKRHNAISTKSGVKR